MKAYISKMDKHGEHKLLVFRETIKGREYVTSLYYQDLTRIDVTAVWVEWHGKEYAEFQKDFVKKLKEFTPSFVIDKPALGVKSFLDSCQEELGIEPILLPMSKVKTDVHIDCCIEGATAEGFDPNEVLWAYQFK